MTIYGQGAPNTMNEIYTDLLASEPPMVDFLPIVRAHLAEVRGEIYIYEYF